MGDVRARVAYLEGLMDGLGIDDQSREGLVLRGVLDAFAEMADAIAAVDEKVEALSEYVGDLDQDLSDLEDGLAAGGGAAGAAGEEEVLRCPDCGRPLAAEAGAGEPEALSVVCPGCGTLVSAQAEGRPGGDAGAS